MFYLNKTLLKNVACDGRASIMLRFGPANGDGVLRGVAGAPKTRIYFLIPLCITENDKISFSFLCLY